MLKSSAKCKLQSADYGLRPSSKQRIRFDGRRSKLATFALRMCGILQSTLPERTPLLPNLQFAICNLQFAMPSRRRSPSPQPPTPNPFALIADGLAVMWVVVVGAQYALVLLVPGAPDVSASYPALLAGVGITGIMSYLKSQRKVVNRER